MWEICAFTSIYQSIAYFFSMQVYNILSLTHKQNNYVHKQPLLEKDMLTVVYYFLLI